MFKLAGFVLIGVGALQIALYAQHGEIGSPRDYPLPLAVGIVAGLLLGLFQHLIVTERRRAKAETAKKDKLYEALALSEERLSLATSRSSIWDWDLVQDKLYMSPGYAASLGYTPQELRVAMQGSTVNLVHPDDVDKYLAKLHAHLENPSKGYLNEHRFKTKSGEYRWFLAFGQSTTDENGKVVRFNGVTTDITERIDLEARLDQVHKLEAIGKLSGGIAHDFNNLLAVIMGNLEMLRDDATHPEQIEMIDASLQATRRGADLTRSMLTFARKAPLEPEILDLNSVVRHAKDWMHRGLPESIEVELSLTAALWQVRLDGPTLENALLNLLLNASDAMDAQGKLTIQTANIRIDEATVDSRRQEIAPGQYVMLCISDTGTGIPEPVLAKIFDPFFSTKGPGKGSGMGLAMVDGFVTQSGGNLQVETEPNKGTTFRLYFPAVTPAKPSEPGLSASVPPRKHGGCAHFLLVEDEAAVRDVLEANLKSAGYRVTTAASGDEALQTYIATPDIDVLITDMVMPGNLQGASLARTIRERCPELPVIFMSGYASGSQSRDAGIPSADIRLTKPFSKQVLLEAIARLCSEQEKTQELLKNSE
jgi:PAS domain S-box-containing protein